MMNDNDLISIASIQKTLTFIIDNEQNFLDTSMSVQDECEKNGITDEGILTALCVAYIERFGLDEDRAFDLAYVDVLLPWIINELMEANSENLEADFRGFHWIDEETKAYLGFGDEDEVAFVVGDNCYGYGLRELSEIIQNIIKDAMETVEVA